MTKMKTMDSMRQRRMYISYAFTDVAAIYPITRPLPLGGCEPE